MAKVEIVLEIPLATMEDLERLAAEQRRRYGPGPVDAAERLLEEGVQQLREQGLISSRRSA